MATQQDRDAAKDLLGHYTATLKIIDHLEAENNRIADDNKRIIREMSISCRLLSPNLPPDWTAMIMARERQTLLQGHNNELFYRHATFQAGDESFARLRQDHEVLTTAHRRLLGRHAALEDDYRRLSQQPISWLSVSGFIVETIFHC